MFSNWLSGERLHWYLKSAQKVRIDRIGKNLLDKKYLPAVVRSHLHEWLRFTKALADKAFPLPSSFYAPEVHDYLKIRFPAGSSSRLRAIKAAIRILIDADRNGEFPRRIRPQPRQQNDLFRTSVFPYLDFLRQHHGVSEITVKKRTFELIIFTEFLESVGILNIGNLSASVIQNYFPALNGRRSGTIVSYASTLRGYLKWAYLKGFLKRDLSAAVVSARHYRLANVVEVLAESETEKVLQSVDRTTAIGKRNYAILLFAARYGMRPSDIRRVTLDNIHWRQGRIQVDQAKTNRELTLPLLPEVTTALIDYIQNGRPTTCERTVFLRHIAPYERFGRNTNFPWIMSDALRRAGIDERSGKQGLYLLRHSLATQMLAAGNSIKTIGDVLGHTHTDSTMIYTKVDLSALRTVAISMKELL